MILADTNALLPLLVDDRPKETEAVLIALDEATATGEAVVVTESVLVEVCAVRRRDYGLGREDVAVAVDSLLSAAPLTSWDAPLASHALTLMRRDPGLAITDCLLAARAERRGAAVLTFDRNLQRALGAE